MIRALIVEDNRTFVQLLEFAIKKTFPNHFEEFEYEVVRCYNDATQKIQP